MVEDGCYNLSYCQHVGRSPLQNFKTKLEYPKWKRRYEKNDDEESQYEMVCNQLMNLGISETNIRREATNGKDKWCCAADNCCKGRFFSPTQLRDHLMVKFEKSKSITKTVVFNMGNGVIADTPDEAMDKFFQRDFQNILNCQNVPHRAICTPDSYIYGAIATKVVIDETNENETYRGDRALIVGKKSEERLFNKIRNAFEGEQVKNTVLISGFQEKPSRKNEVHMELDLLIICKDSKMIIHIECKRSATDEAKIEAFNQLEVGYNYFNSRIPFLPSCGWQYVRVAYFNEGWKPEGNCPLHSPCILTSNSNIVEWLKTVNVCNPASDKSNTDDPTYVNTLKYIFYQMYQIDECITDDDLRKLTERNTEAVSAPEKILFLNKVQFALLSKEVHEKRVAFLSQFGTGKTTLLKEKARQILEQHGKVVFIVFCDPELKGECLLFQSFKEDFKKFHALQTALFLQISSDDSIINEELESKIKDYPGFHFFLDEVPIGQSGISAETMNRISKDPLIANSFLWFACQSEDAPSKELLKEFKCPEMNHPLRYPAYLLEIAKAIKDIKGGTSFPSNSTNPEVYLNRGPRGFFFSMEKETNLSCAVEQVAYILDKEKTNTLIKIDFETKKILFELKKSIIHKRLVFDNMTKLEDILVVSSKDNGLIRGFEFPIIVHFAQSIDGDHVEAIYSRCKSKLMIVCNEDLPKALVPINSNCSFAKVIQVHDSLMPKTFENAIRENILEYILQQLEDKRRPLPIDIRNEASQTGLMVACFSKALKVIKALLERNASLDAVDVFGWASIHHASISNDPEAVRMIVQKMGKDELNQFLNVRTNCGEKAIHLAAEQGCDRTLQELMQTGHFEIDDLAPHTSKPDTGVTPLHVACINGHLTIVKFLLDMGANSNVLVMSKDPINRSFGWLPREFQWMSCLQISAERGDVDMAKEIIQHGHFVNYKNSYGHTALHIASKKGQLDMVQYLVKEASAAVNLRDEDGRTALFLASREQHTDIVRFLVNEVKADVTLSENNGPSPLHVAADKGYLDIVECLVKEGRADVQLKDRHGYAPHHLASIRGHLDVLQWLVNEGGADCKLKDKNSKTCLHLASTNGHLHVVKWLTGVVGLKANFRDEYKQTALHCAATNGNLDIIKWLINESGARIFMKDIYGRKPVDVAITPEVELYLRSLQ